MFSKTSQSSLDAPKFLRPKVMETIDWVEASIICTEFDSELCLNLLCFLYNTNQVKNDDGSIFPFSVYELFVKYEMMNVFDRAFEMEHKSEDIHSIRNNIIGKSTGIQVIANSFKSSIIKRKILVSAYLSKKYIAYMYMK